MMRPTIPERHLVSRIGWLRAAVLGANDGILSTASLILGVAAADGTRGNTLIAAVAALVAGAMSMAAGEYVSVSSQHDTEQADLSRERAELKADIVGEGEELAQIYRERGVDDATAHLVSRELMAKDALGAHARDELGITATGIARPIQAALTSAATFTFGASLPVMIVIIAPPATLIVAESVGALVFLAVLGAVGGVTGGANVWRAMARVTFWGALALAVTASIGRLVGTTL
ncbi:VIT family protein [Sphingomonas sp. 10B4]|nr:VIT family protein [Sphingomonas sp. 10B4]MDY7524558.1 VIT family protein [Sphingomonas sp. 10B4]